MEQCLSRLTNRSGVKSGKAFAGLLKMAEEGNFQATDNVLFLHSGGAGGLFAVM